MKSTSWAIGTYFSKLVTLPRDPLASTGAQMIVGGASLLVVGVLVGEQNASGSRTSACPSLLALAYLIVFGSVLAYTAYTWLLQHAPVSRVATYAYVNPVVAVILGALLLNETIDLTMIVGAAMIVVSVALVVRTESRPAAPVGALERQPPRAAPRSQRQHRTTRRRPRVSRPA